MQKEERKFADSLVFEGMTSIRAILEADPAVNDRKIEKILFDKKKLPKIRKEIGYLRAISGERGFTVEAVGEDALSGLTVGNSHGGIVCVAGERTIPRFTEDSLPDAGFLCMIQGIEDPYNFGYALRSLYACGCDGILLPERNWMSAAGVVCRSSAGASERIPAFTADPLSAAECLKKRGFSVICAEEKTEHVLGKCALKLPLLLVVGGEKRGISGELLAVADLLVKIPYCRDFRASLSAASAATIFAYDIARQNF